MLTNALTTDIIILMTESAKGVVLYPRLAINCPVGFWSIKDANSISHPSPAKLMNK